MKARTYTKIAENVRRNPETVSKYVKEYKAVVRAAGVTLHAFK